MTLIRREGVVEDPWTFVEDGAPLPKGASVIVTLERWQTDSNALLAHDGRLGVRLKSDQTADAIADALAKFDLVALEFPTFKDGRAYSTARLLRERHGFTGELRAVGNVLRDQLFFMLRCGFDAFALPDHAMSEAWLEAFGEISVVYQPTADGRPPIATFRR
ncbi:MAG: DUF934 domain-containing protein [Alphaproteobacteria bacterium]|nr:DUF934 domain-containing protein [Alphaproteobacteria bacterium]